MPETLTRELGCAGKTHRELFSEWYEDLMGEPLAEAMAQNPRPDAAVALFDQMMRDIMGGGACADAMGQVRFYFGKGL